MDEAWSWEPFKWYFHDWMPGVTDAEYVVNLYDGEIRYMDHHLARVFEALAPVRDNTIVVITADHGEILNEQLGYFDHHGLYEPNVHIPLIMSWPGTLPAGRRVPGMVQNLDVAQTLLDLTGIQQSYDMEGLSLLPAIYGVRDRNYSEVFFSEATWQVKRAVRTDRWKFIRSIEPDPHGRPERELFDLEADPLEQTNLAEDHPETVADLEGRLDAWIARRLVETGRDSDPVADQGACASSIGQPKPDERVGAGRGSAAPTRSGHGRRHPRPERAQCWLGQCGLGPSVAGTGVRRASRHRGRRRRHVAPRSPRLLRLSAVDLAVDRRAGPGVGGVRPRVRGGHSHHAVVHDDAVGPAPVSATASSAT